MQKFKRGILHVAASLYKLVTNRLDLLWADDTIQFSNALKSFLKLSTLAFPEAEAAFVTELLSNALRGVLLLKIEKPNWPLFSTYTLN